TTTNGAYAVGGATAQLAFTASTTGTVHNTVDSSATAGWKNTANMRTTTTGGTPATVDVGDSIADTYPVSGSPSTETLTGTWTATGGGSATTNADPATADGAYATAAVSAVTTSQFGASGTATAVSTSGYGAWTNIGNAEGTNNAGYASGAMTSTSGT